VRPLAPGNGENGRYLVLFQDLSSIETGGVVESAGAGGDGEQAHVQHLEDELRATKEHLQSIIEEFETTNEELQSANEELVSANEELQSSNEELETSKEEFESANEELHTVNAELSHKLDELSAANNDLKNLIESTRIPLIFLDRELRVKSFTPAISEIFHLIDADIGRPLGHMAPRLDHPDLGAEVREVLRTHRDIEREVTAPETGASYLMRVVPYRTVDNVVEGAVLTLIDITERKRAEEHQRMLLSELNHRVKNTLATVQAIAVQTLGHSSSVEEFSETFVERLKNLANAHGLLTHANWEGVGLRELLEEGLAAYRSGDSITVSGEDVVLNPKGALALVMVLHELATNASKYGALSVPAGRVEVRWRTHERDGGR
jgi:two-component system, chemotaxis family, CheB/CheR fusion protein